MNPSLSTARLPILSTANAVFCSLVFLLAIGGVSLSAGSPVLEDQVVEALDSASSAPELRAPLIDTGASGDELEPRPVTGATESLSGVLEMMVRTTPAPTPGSQD